MEDIDVAFHHTVNREPLNEAEVLEESMGPKGSETQDQSARVSLSGLLNALDGVGAQEGRILFATTNRYEALDPALRRPGRIDLTIEFKLASQFQAGELFKKFYLPTPRTSPQKAPTTSKDEGGNGTVLTPTYGAPIEPETKKPTDDKSPAGEQDQPFAAIVQRSNRDFDVHLEDLNDLVEKFRELIPERKFSMAALQGFLLMHKNQPRRAVECAGRWVREEKAKKESDLSLGVEGQ